MLRVRCHGREPPRMQSDAIRHEAREDRVSDGAISRDDALRMLVSYSRSTGQRWQAIVKEIWTLLEKDESDIRRQDFEGWERRRTGRMNDQKFRIVLDFLTHEGTMKRPEFSEVRRILDKNLRRDSMGRALVDLYKSNPVEALEDVMDNFLPASSISHEERYSDQICGLFLGRIIERKVFLSITRFPGQSYFAVHLIGFPQDGIEIDGDTPFIRESGLAVSGKCIIIFLRDIISRSPSFLSSPRPLRPFSQTLDSLSLVNNDYFTGIIIPSLQKSSDKLVLSHLRGMAIDFERTDSDAVEAIIDRFRWDTVL